MVKLSDYIIKRLADYGVKHIFMISGGGAMHLVDSVGRSKKIKYICNHHEQASAISAEGYARASGSMGVVVVTSGPGGTNTLTGVIGQWLDSIPCLYISGQVKRETCLKNYPRLNLRQLGDQEINIVDIVRPVTKYAETVLDPDKIGYHLDRAVYLARHGRPGPVWLDIPLDIQASFINPAKLAKYDPKEDALRFNIPLIRKQVKELISRIRSSERPVLLAGHGIRSSSSGKKFIRLAGMLNIPVLTSINGNDIVESDYHLFSGRPGICGDRLGNIVMQNSDLFLAVGARLGIRQVSYDYKSLARQAWRAMVDIDKNELKKPTLEMHMKIWSDAGIFIDEMLRQLNGRKIKAKKPWLGWINERRRTLPGVLDDNVINPRYVNSYVFTKELFKLLSSGDIVVTGNGSAYTGTYQAMKIKKGMRVFSNQGCASMGYDLPAAIGACFARDRKPVVLITGDGSIQMNIQELQTIVSHKLPLKIFVLNNQGYLAIRTSQDAYFQGRYYASCGRGGVSCPDICRVAEAYGIPAIKMPSGKNIITVIKKALAFKGPVVCEVFMDPKQTLLPKLSSEVSPDGRLISHPLEDMYPFLERQEFKRHMIIKHLEEKINECA